MRILHITSSSYGGAGIAAKRSFIALKKSGKDVSFLSLEEEIGFRGIKKNRVKIFFYKLIRKLLTVWQKFFVQNSSELITSKSMNFLERAYGNLFSEFDVIHIHSMYNVLNLKSLESLKNSDISIVITLHDERVLTGGCHYAVTCIGLFNGCHKCPKVRSVYADLPSKVFQESLEVFKNYRNIKFVCPSSWLADRASRSPILMQHKISCIPNPVPSIFFKPRVNTTRETFTFGFVGQDTLNPYKGFSILLEALELLNTKTNIKFKLKVATLKRLGVLGASFPIETFAAHNDTEILDFYNSIDCLVVPSTSDNLPNVISEALATGLPVIGSNIGGIPELLNRFEQPIFESGNSLSLLKSLQSILTAKPATTDRNGLIEFLSEESYAEQISKIYN